MADQELLRAFFTESGEILERLEADLARVRAAPADLEGINALFRGLHTIKGNSSFLALEKVTKLAHAAENLLDRARNKEMAASPALLQCVENVIEGLRRQIVDQDSAFDPAPVLGEIQAVLTGQAAPAPVPSPDPVTPAAKVAVGSFVRVDEAKVNKIVSLVGELELLRYGLEKMPEKMDRLGREGADLRFEMDMQVSKLSRLTRSLSGLVFGVRLVPVNQVFLRFPKVVKELATKLRKEIKFAVENGDAELDKAIVEAIADPMIHLIRNAADHGIESPAERERAGKSRAGTITLNSYVRGNFVYIEISDDGRGIDGDKILKKAIEKGIVPADKADTFTESKKLALIFAPGFSTAETVTDISGRGVGMDVVKSNINRLKGTVLIDSNVGQGTTIRLRFPMSVVVLFSLFLEVNGTSCAVAVDQVNESMDYLASEVLARPPVDAKPGQYLALYSLRSLLWGDAEEAGARKTYHTLRFKEKKGQNMAFVVDDYSSIEEAIVQSVDSYVSSAPGVQGATVRKDGSVGLVLNPENIVEHALRAKPLGYVRVKEKTITEESTGGLSDFLTMAG